MHSPAESGRGSGYLVSMAIVIIVRDSLAMALVHDQHVIKLLRFSSPASCSEMVIRQMVHSLENISQRTVISTGLSHSLCFVFDDGRPTDTISQVLSINRSRP